MQLMYFPENVCSNMKLICCKNLMSVLVKIAMESTPFSFALECYAMFYWFGETGVRT